MRYLAITLSLDARHDACGVCGRPTAFPAGANLTADGTDVVCTRCGRERAPALAALVQLARVAERVGRMERHTLTPPLTALLDLARAAEDYARAVVPEQRRQAA